MWWMLDLKCSLACTFRVQQFEGPVTQESVPYLAALLLSGVSISLSAHADRQRRGTTTHLQWFRMRNMDGSILKTQARKCVVRALNSHHAAFLLNDAGMHVIEV